VWYMDGATRTGTVYLDPVVDLNWTVVGTGDFNADSQIDILWRNTSSGQNVVWFMYRTTLIGTEYLFSVQ
ncbi:MAG TPA: VCBS repeat-containing protein, partial [Syntrophobacteraceae bacterium]|nr:VCBS repeat-containing protein [Syntrophobacteraceae bacterium]